MSGGGGALQASLGKGKGQPSLGKQLLGSGADRQPSFPTKALSCHCPVWSLDFPPEFVEGPILSTHPTHLTDVWPASQPWSRHSSPPLFLSFISLTDKFLNSGLLNFQGFGQPWASGSSVVWKKIICKFAFSLEFQNCVTLLLKKNLSAFHCLAKPEFPRIAPRASAAFWPYPPILGFPYLKRQPNRTTRKSQSTMGSPPLASLLTGCLPVEAFPQTSPHTVLPFLKS